MNPDDTQPIDLDDEAGDPNAIDVGVLNDVPEHERLDVDEPEPNDDADDDYTDVGDGAP